MSPYAFSKRGYVVRAGRSIYLGENAAPRVGTAFKARRFPSRREAVDKARELRGFGRGCIMPWEVLPFAELVACGGAQ